MAVYRSSYSVCCLFACPLVWETLFVDLVSWGIDWWGGQLQLLVIYQIVLRKAQRISIWWKGLIKSPHATSGCWISIFLLFSQPQLCILLTVGLLKGEFMLWTLMHDVLQAATSFESHCLTNWTSHKPLVKKAEWDLGKAWTREN